MKMILKLLAIVLMLFILFFIVLYFTRLQTVKTIQKVTDYPDGYDLYKVDVRYDYQLDKMLSRNYSDNQMVVDAIAKQSLPLVPIHMESPDYSCSAFGILDTQDHSLMGRNYDFDIDTSALLVHCTPKDGYQSVGMAALDHMGISSIQDLGDKLSTLPCPFICLDGMNEKGVSIAILMLDSPPVNQETSLPDLFTTLGVRLVLDQAASTQEAVDLLRGYDMFSVAGGDYHYFLTDASGDSRVVEYDFLSDTRELIDTPVRSATNFYQIYIDQVLPNQYNGKYGHGRERYDRMEAIFSQNEDSLTRELAWEAHTAVWQLPNPQAKTSNTQWSVLYDNTELSEEIVIRRDAGHSTSYKLMQNDLTRKF